MGYIQFMGGIEAGCASALASVGRSSARNPFKTLAACFLVACACAAGFSQAVIVTDGNLLWVDQNSEPKRNLQWVESLFEPAPVSSALLLRAKEAGGNLLTKAAFDEAFDIADSVLNLTAAVEGTSISYDDICFSTPFGCAFSGALRFWSFDRRKPVGLQIVALTSNYMQNSMYF